MNIYMIEDGNISKYQCENCGNTNLVEWSYGKCLIAPCDFVNVKCAWCNEVISIDISNTTKKWIEKKEIQFQETLITCPHCRSGNETRFHVGGSITYSAFAFRALTQGEKNAVSTDVVQQFVCGNSIYKTYGLIHPYSVYDFCEINNFDEDEVFEIIKNMKVDIFTSLDLNELDEVKYVDEFSKLKLKEDAMTSAGGASLSGLMGR